MNISYWKCLQFQNYKHNKESVVKILGCLGPVSDLKISYTYISILDNKDPQKTHYFFVFTPFITGRERMWSEKNTDPWDCDYSLFDTNNKYEYIYYKSDFMTVNESLYKIIYEDKRDIRIFKYEDGILKDPDSVYIGMPPILKSIEFKGDMIKYLSYSEWYSKKECISNVKLIFSGPQCLVPFPVEDIVLEITNNGIVI